MKKYVISISFPVFNPWKNKGMLKNDHPFVEMSWTRQDEV